MIWRKFFFNIQRPPPLDFQKRFLQCRGVIFQKKKFCVFGSLSNMSKNALLSASGWNPKLHNYHPRLTKLNSKLEVLKLWNDYTAVPVLCSNNIVTLAMLQHLRFFTRFDSVRSHQCRTHYYCPHFEITTTFIHCHCIKVGIRCYPTPVYRGVLPRPRWNCKRTYREGVCNHTGHSHGVGLLF